MKWFLGRFLQVVLAYSAAILVSCLFYVLIFVLTEQRTMPANFLEFFTKLIGFYLLVSFNVAIFALPGWLVMMGLSGGLWAKPKSFYLKAGALNASIVPAIVFFAYLFEGKFTPKITASEGVAFIFFTIVLVVGGLCAGWTYWCVEGRQAKGWRRAKLQK